MAMRTVSMGVLILALGIAQPASAGFYSSIDTREETRWSRDYETVFHRVLADLKAIPEAKVETDFPMRRRHMFIEDMGRASTQKLETLEQKITYSTVLIRRGRAFDAVRFLEPVYEKDNKNFILLSQFATAHFLSGDPNYEVKAGFYMKKAIANWPKNWEDLNEQQKKLLKSFNWDGDFDFDRFRRIEVCFERLIANRLKERHLLAEKKRVKETVDPIFLDAQGNPIRFVNDQEVFEAGRIMTAAKDELPRDDVEVIEQLLIWMPTDNRLLWLLGEAFNASAMEHKDNPKAKNQAIASAFQVFDRLTDFRRPTNYGFLEIQSRHKVLDEYLKSIQPPVVKLPEEEASPWWRIGVGFLTGFAVGIFALWQIQEVRRRRAARS